MATVTEVLFSVMVDISLYEMMMQNVPLATVSKKVINISQGNVETRLSVVWAVNMTY